jgi:type IV pilus assembly protein PilP
MKARPGKRALARRFYLVFVLLLTLAAWTSSTSAIERTGPVPQAPAPTAAQPSQAPVSPAGEAQQAEPAQQPTPTASEQASQVQAEQGAKPEANMPPPATEPAAGQMTEPAAPQTPVAAATQTETAGVGCPPEYVPLILKTNTSLMTANFTFYPVKTLDPFVPFVETMAQLHSEGEDEPKTEGGPPLTPLQKMTVSEIEKGLKAITWGDLGKRAVIEDSTGRGYIVAVGTPAGERSGVITQIFSDRLVIQQEIWDRKAKKRFPQDYTIKLSKKTDNKQ